MAKKRNDVNIFLGLNFTFMALIIPIAGIYSPGILSYYFVKKGGE